MIQVQINQCFMDLEDVKRGEASGTTPLYRTVLLKEHLAENEEGNRYAKRTISSRKHLNWLYFNTNLFIGNLEENQKKRFPQMDNDIM